ncbi:Gfo/Idh/MocA family protein [Aureimonas mangrovi]|uniref:Gfo/Idh/MocA family protein n=1 Tax=Aureimonas mangrovi TaxID=2758041 RepID=UPI00163DD722|nr:Gfo/Idh/MocA family oxidoreductase [Aureimonas mangrovi]
MTTPQTPFRWGVIGAGGIARRFCADMPYSRHGRIAAVGARRPEAARALAAAVGPNVAALDIETLLAHNTLDAIYVATPNAQHLEYALAVIASGKHVLVEKPIAPNAEDAMRLAQTAQEAGLLAMEAMWMRFTPGIERLRMMTREGVVGEPVRLEASLSFGHGFDAAKPVHDPVAGGALLDLGVYPVSLALDLLGRPDNVAAAGTLAPNGSIAEAAIVLSYASGALATLSCGFGAEGPNEAVLTGREGTLRAHRAFINPPLLSVRRTIRKQPTGSGVTISQTPSPWRERVKSLRAAAAAIKARPIPIALRGTGLQYQADHFVECVRADMTDSPIMPLSQSIETLEIVRKADRLVRGASTT